MTIEKAYRKATRKARRAPECMWLYTVSLAKWLTAYQGDSSRSEWLATLILKNCAEQDEDEAGEGVYFDDQHGGLALDDLGVLLHFDTLTGFFGDEEVIGMRLHLVELNRLPRAYRETAQAAAAMPKEKRAELLRLWKNYRPQDEQQEEVRRNMLRIVRTAKRNVST